MMKKAAIIATVISIVLSSFIIFPMNNVKAASHIDFKQDFTNRSAATTGESFTFNIGTTKGSFSEVHVNYTLDYWGKYSNISLNKSSDISYDNWTSTIQIPSSAIILMYNYSAKDSSNGWYNYPNLIDVPNSFLLYVADNDAPTIDAYNNTGGTTGDSYKLNVTASDNIAVIRMSANWTHGSLEGRNIPMTKGSNGYWTLPIMLDHSTSSMTYNVTAMDGTNHVIGSNQTVTVSDNDVPTIDAYNNTPGTTGDPYTLNVTASDNIAVSGMTATWSHGSRGGTNIAMTDDGDGTWSLLIMLDHSTSSMTYTVTATDGTNPVTGSQQTVTVSDNDAPSIDAYNNPAGTTGDTYTLNVTVSDNIAVTGVTVTWSHGARGGASVSMTDDSDGTWSLDIVLDHSKSTMTYTVTATDGTNPVTGSQQTVTVSDNDAPSIDAYNNAGGTTGDAYTVNVTASDNIAVTGMTVTWSHGSRGGTNVAMTDDGDGTWSLDIVLDHSTNSMTYTVTATDGTNPVTGSPQTVAVTDNDAPTINAYNNAAGTTGDTYNLDVTASDNIAVTGMTVSWSHGTLGATDAAMTDDSDGTWSLSIRLDHSTKPLTYNVTVTDGLNRITGPDQIVTVTDNDAPSIEAYNNAAGTTGDTYTLNVTASDNIAVTGMTATWSHGSRSGKDMSLTNDGDGTWSLSIVLDHSTGSLIYNVTVTDGTNRITGTDQIVAVLDNDRPTFGADTTTLTGTTGDSLAFNVAVYDNIGVQTVTVEYWFGSGSHENTTMNGAGPYTRQITIPSSSLAILHYIFHAGDAKGNWESTPTRDISIYDNDPPTFSDSSSSSSTTGDQYTFSFSVVDNIGVQTVTVEYWFGTGKHENETMTGTSPFSFQVQIPGGSLAPLQYFFSASDKAGNWGNTSKPSKTVAVLDNDPPTFTDSSPNTGTTGDQYSFSVEVEDNIEVRDVTVEYWFGSGKHLTANMSEDDLYTYIITIPSGSTQSLHYIFHAIDTSGNSVSHPQKDVQVQDNDAPSFTDSSPENSTTGGHFKFDVSASDNMGVKRVAVTWSHDTSGGTDVSLSNDGDGTWSLIIDLDQSTSEMTYTITVFDTSDLSFSGTERSVSVLDLTPPVVKVMNDFTVYSGLPLSITIEATDNIGIDEVKWTGLPSTFYGIKFTGYINQSGEYNVKVSVKDPSANAKEIEFKITVLPKNNDMDGDGIPDLIETQYGLDPLNSADAGMDPDKDGLTNLQEYRNGTDPNDEDSDGDEMEDGWELEYGLNPLVYSKDNDEDGDGKTDFEEHEEGTNPIKPPGKESGFNYLWGLLTTPIVLIIIAGIVAFMILRKRRRIIKLLGPAEPGGVKEIFISYAHKDRDTAYSICNHLEEMDMRCWIAPRDVTPGVTWGKAIIKAINSARIMVLVFSADSNESEQVLREVERAVNKKIPIILFRITDITPSEELEYYISAIHWLDAINEPLEEHIDHLAKTVQQTLEAEIETMEQSEKKDLLPKKGDSPSTPPKTPKQPIPEDEPIKPIEQSEPPKEVQT
ncbi:MAG: TIR domain-containing protein [Thermoplasmatota archaeon]